MFSIISTIRIGCRIKCTLKLFIYVQTITYLSYSYGQIVSCSVGYCQLNLCNILIVVSNSQFMKKNGKTRRKSSQHEHERTHTGRRFQ